MVRFAQTLVAVSLLIVALPRPAAAELTASDLALIVNRNVPASREIADYYAQARGVPDGRIIEIDVPDADSIPRDVYLRNVAEPVRAALRERGLAGEVTCLVTTWGVPLRVDTLKPTDAEQAEFGEVDKRSRELAEQLRPIVDRAVATAEAVGATVPELPELAGPLQREIDRLALAQQLIQRRAGDLSGGEQVSLQQTAQALSASLNGPTAGGVTPLNEAEVEALKAAIAQPGDADARATVRELSPRIALFQQALLLSQQRRVLDADQSDGCLDSELATLPMTAPAASLWLANPLAGGRGSSGLDGDALMVARLDGPSVQDVRDLIAESLLTERDGLDGKIVIDSRGMRLPGADGKPDGYAPFDEQLRQLAAALRERATLEVVHDDAPETFERKRDGSAAVDDVAVYVGWYRLRDYNRPFDLARGAVAFHVASFEMVSLHNAGERGWARGLLADGAAATLGPVSEPYLSAFPPPAIFVPLILEGRLTLAEAYWSSVPHVSWKMGLVGDPLYRPFAARPGLRDAAD